MTDDIEPMDCERYDKIALNLLYGELDELTAAATRRHLHHCARCRGISSAMQATKELTDVHLLDPPEGLRDKILLAERKAQRDLPLRARLGRTVSVMAGYAMRPQLAMAALLLLMVSTSLVFLRARPAGHDQVSVTERGVPGLDVEAAARHSIVTEPLPPEPDSPGFLAQKEEPRAAAKSRSAPERAPARARTDDGADEEAQPPGAPDFDQALGTYHAGRYAEAEQQFGRVAAAGGPNAARAALHEAHSARNGSGCQRASDLYDTVAARYPGTPTADEASWHAASCYRALGQTDRAAAHYRMLAARPGYAERAGQALAALEADAQPPGDVVAARKSAAGTVGKSGAGAATTDQAAEAAAAPRPAKPVAPASKAAPAEAEP